MFYLQLEQSIKATKGTCALSPRLSHHNIMPAGGAGEFSAIEGSLCPQAWCFLASTADDKGDICVSCKSFVLGTTHAADAPFRCPKLCSATRDGSPPLCEMADLLRESVMPSAHFGDAGFFPCRVGSDTQRRQVNAHHS